VKDATVVVAAAAAPAVTPAATTTVTASESDEATAATAAAATTTSGDAVTASGADKKKRRSKPRNGRGGRGSADSDAQTSDQADAAGADGSANGHAVLEAAAEFSAPAGASVASAALVPSPAPVVASPVQLDSKIVLPVSPPRSNHAKTETSAPAQSPEAKGGFLKLGKWEANVAADVSVAFQFGSFGLAQDDEAAPLKSSHQQSKSWEDAPTASSGENTNGASGSTWNASATTALDSNTVSAAANSSPANQQSVGLSSSPAANGSNTSAGSSSHVRAPPGLEGAGGQMAGNKQSHGNNSRAAPGQMRFSKSNENMAAHAQQQQNQQQQQHSMLYNAGGAPQYSSHQPPGIPGVGPNRSNNIGGPIAAGSAPVSLGYYPSFDLNSPQAFPHPYGGSPPVLTSSVLPVSGSVAGGSAAAGGSLTAAPAGGVAGQSQQPAGAGAALPGGASAAGGLLLQQQQAQQQPQNQQAQQQQFVPGAPYPFYGNPYYNQFFYGQQVAGYYPPQQNQRVYPQPQQRGPYASDPYNNGSLYNPVDPYQQQQQQPGGANFSSQDPSGAGPYGPGGMHGGLSHHQQAGVPGGVNASIGGGNKNAKGGASGNAGGLGNNVQSQQQQAGMHGQQDHGHLNANYNYNLHPYQSNNRPLGMDPQAAWGYQQHQQGQQQQSAGWGGGMMGFPSTGPSGNVGGLPNQPGFAPQQHHLGGAMMPGGAQQAGGPQQNQQNSNARDNNSRSFANSNAPKPW
jgi:hypothetical protein